MLTLTRLECRLHGHDYHYTGTMRINDGKHGYFIATNREELRRAISPLEHHAGEMLKRVEHLKQIDLEA